MSEWQEGKVQYFAHSGTRSDRSDWQRLEDHALRVARLAADFAAPFGLERGAYLAGLLHDLGKYTGPFQSRLSGDRDAVDHSTAGAAHMLELVPLTSKDAVITHCAAYGILGHHAGLPDWGGPGGFDERIARFRRDPQRAVAPIWREELKPDGTKLFPASFHWVKDNTHKNFQVAFMARMIFSCLIDADFKDTEAFYCKIEGRQKNRDWITLTELLPSLLARFDGHMAKLGGSATKINVLRAETLAHVRSKAADAPGLFTLTVPTGGGKTLASLAFALDHAKAHGARRIIYAIPFTSIIDQTASIFRDVLGGGDDIVLEHHSAIDEETAPDRRDRTSRDKLKLAMEDWAAPVVVTTNVQLFESLFAARTSRARKLHNVARSVIILDEAQTIPRPLLIPCMRVLEELARNYGCTIVLCTATQPALDSTRLKGGGLALQGRELAPDPVRLSNVLRRADIRRAGAMANADLVAELGGQPQALVIVNSRKHAYELYQDAANAGLDGVVHLTTRQCAVHRRTILDDVRERLKRDGEPCRVIATSLIEAGVDVDFPRVWRAEAGLDQIIQAAGRCNREGRRPREESLVTVFSTPDYGAPAEIKGLIGDMERTASAVPDLMSLAAIEQYFKEVYWRLDVKLDAKEIMKMFSMGPRGPMFDFRKAAAEFRMIESGMVPVIVPFDDIAKEAVKNLAVADIPSGYLARMLQSYVVQVPPVARQKLIDCKHVAFVRPDLRGDQFAVLQTESLYCGQVGLVWEDAEYMSEEALIV